MEVNKVYWWMHNSNNGQYSPARVHKSVAERLRVNDGATKPRGIGDYIIPGKSEIEKELSGLKCEVLDGEYKHFIYCDHCIKYQEQDWVALYRSEAHNG